MERPEGLNLKRRERTSDQPGEAREGERGPGPGTTWKNPWPACRSARSAPWSARRGARREKPNRTWERERPPRRTERAWP